MKRFQITEVEYEAIKGKEAATKDKYCTAYGENHTFDKLSINSLL